MTGAGILVVKAEVTLPHKLEALRVLSFFGHRNLGKALFNLTACQHLQTLGIDIIEEILIRTVGIGIGKEIIVYSHLSVRAVIRVDPVDRCTLDLAPVGRIAAAAFRISSSAWA